MRFTILLSIVTLISISCSSKKEKTTPTKESTPVQTQTPPKEPAPKKIVPKKAAPVKVIPKNNDPIAKSNGLTNEELTLIKTITQSFINKAINSKADKMVNTIVKSIGKDNFSKAFPLFIKGTIQKITTIGVKLVVNVFYKKIGKKVTKDILERIVKPMIEKAAKTAFSNAFKNVMAK
jgi:hypothetical protein